MLRRTALFLLISLFFLPSCRTRPIDTPETTAADTAEPPIVEETVREHDERLAALFAETEGPVTVHIMYWNSPFALKNQKRLAKLWSAPHVLDVLCTAIVHWIDITDEGSLSMIGQFVVDLDPAAISEGRWYETDKECCLNRAEYERLLADPESSFTGIGDMITYTEKVSTLGEYLNEITVEPISRSFTVVGIVEDEGKYSDPAYGVHHVYTSIEDVEAMLKNYQADRLGFESPMDEEVYSITSLAWKIEGIAFYKPDPDREGKVLIRYADDKIYTEDEWMDLFYNLPCNAGYFVEVTLDSGKNYADYAEYYRLQQFSDMTVTTIEERRITGNKSNEEYLEEHLKKYPHLLPEAVEKLRAQLAPKEINPTVARLIELGDTDEWRYCNKAPFIIHPLRVEE